MNRVYWALSYESFCVIETNHIRINCYELQWVQVYLDTVKTKAWLYITSNIHFCNIFPHPYLDDIESVGVDRQLPRGPLFALYVVSYTSITSNSTSFSPKLHLDGIESFGVDRILSFTLCCQLSELNSWRLSKTFS